ncbi:MAG: membrane protein insertion efficiency factor YidD [Pirellulales bacterium]
MIIQAFRWCSWWLVRPISWAVGKFLVALICVYQVLLSPLLGKQCRFQPSCSRYFQESVIKYGPLRGTWKGLTRICRCHPWNRGGYDPP